MISLNASQKARIETANSQQSAISPEEFLPPYLHGITEDIVLIDNGKLMTTVVIKGSPFDLESPKQVQASFEMFKDQLVNIGKGNISKLAIWTHIIKKKIKLKTDYKFESKFMQRYSNRYIYKMNTGNFFEVSYYMTFVYKFSDLDDGIEELNNIVSSSMSFLKRYNSSVLKVKVNNDGLRCKNKEFLHYLYNHNEVEYKTIAKDSIVDSISTESDLYFGYDIAEIRYKNSLKKEYMTCYNMKDYPSRTKNGMWDRAILEYPCEFILCQSFIYFSTSKSLKVIDDQINKMTSTDDNAVHQLAELEVGKGYVSSQEIFFGSLHGALIVYGDTQEEVVEHGINLTGEFSAINKYGVRFVKSTLDSIFTFFSIFPSSKYRPLNYPHTSTNLASGFSLHNYSIGKEKGNPIGDGTAIMPLNTAIDGLHFINTHYSNPNQNVTGQKIAGHALFLGATGAGKTTLETTMMGFTTRFDPDIFGIDFNRSFELAFRAFGGSYFAIREGEDTGLNPFQLKIPEEQYKRYLGFLYDLVKACAIENGAYTLTAEEESVIKIAVDSVMRLPFEHRRFSLLMQSIPNGTPLKLKLSKWCHSEGGRYAWALDSPVNRYDPSEYKKIAFDSTEILENPSPVTEPILATLFYFKNLMQKTGKLMLTLIEEFWVACNYKLTQKMIKGALKAGRLKGEFVWLISQSPEDAIECEIFAPIVQQTPTKILLPNPDAKYKGSYQLIGLSEYEFEKLVKLDKESRKFLIKQSNTASICKMDLYGFDEFLPIISGTTEDIDLVERIRKELNSDDPDIWIPEFYKRKGIFVKENYL